MILIDSRVGSKEFLEPLSAKLNGQVNLCTLTSGDVAWEGNYKDGVVAIGLEIKVLGDMLASMRSGRMVDQLHRMSEDYSICYLLIQGSYAPNEQGLLCTPTRGGWAPLNLQSREQKGQGRRRSYFTYAELDKFIASIEAVENVIVRKSCNRADSVQQIVNLFSYWQKPWLNHDSTRGAKIQSGALAYRASLCRRIAAELPGVGSELAGRVSRHFRTVDKMICALPSEWAEIRWKTETGRNNGISERKALEICAALKKDME